MKPLHWLKNDIQKILREDQMKPLHWFKNDISFWENMKPYKFSGKEPLHWLQLKTVDKTLNCSNDPVLKHPLTAAMFQQQKNETIANRKP